MKGLLLAAGMGTRLRPLTDDCPKPMVPVAGVPLIEYLLHWARTNGVTDLAVNLHHWPERLRSHVGDGSRSGVRIHYSLEREILGSAGALVPLRGFFEAEDEFVVLYGDVLTAVSLEPVLRLHRLKRADVTIVASYVADPTRCGILDIAGSGRVWSIEEKPNRSEVFSNWANGGVYVCGSAVLAALPDPCPVPYDFASDLFPRLLGNGSRVFAYRTDATLIDVGDPDRLQAASDAVRLGALSTYYSAIREC